MLLHIARRTFCGVVIAAGLLATKKKSVSCSAEHDVCKFNWRGPSVFSHCHYSASIPDRNTHEFSMCVYVWICLVSGQSAMWWAMLNADANSRRTRGERFRIFLSDRSRLVNKSCGKRNKNPSDHPRIFKLLTHSYKMEMLTGGGHSAQSHSTKKRYSSKLKNYKNDHSNRRAVLAISDLKRVLKSLRWMTSNVSFDFRAECPAIHHFEVNHIELNIFIFYGWAVWEFGDGREEIRGGKF